MATLKTACGATLLLSSVLVVIEPNSPFGSKLTGNLNDEDEETTPPPVDRSGHFQLVDQNIGKVGHNQN